MHYDVIAVGSTTIDCFVDTGEKLFQPGKSSKKNLVSVPFGAKIRVDGLQFLSGGGATNCGVSFARMGLKTAILSKFGGEQSKAILDELKKEGIDTSLVVKAKDTGFSVVLDAKGHDRTILVYKASNNLMSYDEIKLSKIKTKWIYMATMMGKSFQSSVRLAQYAKKQGIKVAFNPSNYLAAMGTTKLKRMLSCVDLLVLNKEEAASLLGKKKQIKQTAKELLSHLKKDAIVIITNGKEGAYAYDGLTLYFIESNGKDPVEATGAGDSFASGFLSARIKGKNIEDSLQIGQANAQSVIQYHGAKNILLTYRQALANVKKNPAPMKLTVFSKSTQS